MIKFGSYAVNMGGYTDFAGLILSESAKYLLLLLFAVLSVRVWRRLPRLSPENRRGNLVLAGCATAAAAAIGYFSICHSLSRLYLHYGTQAFNAGHFDSAFLLFKKSSGYWKNADALGKQGVCLLQLDKPGPGLQMIDAAGAMRPGGNSTFEAFNAGLVYFFQEQPARAIPFLEKASTDPAYTWTVTKLFATAYLDNGQPQDAARLMKPFASVEVAETDHAYVAASLDWFDGNRAGAEMLVKKFGAGDLPPFWKSRFDKLRAKIQN